MSIQRIGSPRQAGAENRPVKAVAGNRFGPVPSVTSLAGSIDNVIDDLSTDLK